MTWVSWRLFRRQAWTAAAALVLAGAGLLVLGTSVRHDDAAGVARCASATACRAARIALTDRYDTVFTLLAVLVLAVPAVCGMFWGAPLVARELETGTHRLAWTQSVSRTAWLAARLGVVLLAAAVVAGVLGFGLAWAGRPLDRIDSRLSVVAFDSRNLTPIAYAVFATALGVACGVLLRRTLPAMALTLVVFAGVQLAVPDAVRRHLAAPVTVRRAFSAGTVAGLPLTFEDHPGGGVRFVGFRPAGAWILSTSYLEGSDGRPADVERCLDAPAPATLVACIARRGVHWTTTYHPASRYWSFAWAESAGFLVAAAGLAAFSAWRVRRVVA